MVSDPSTRALPLKLIEWRSFHKNTLRGFATVQLGALKIIDVSVHVLNGKNWCGLPAKPMINADGTVQRDERDRVRYAQIMEWTNKETAEKFRAAVCDALERDYPDALRAE